jgi:hypothetical protein
MNPLKIYVASSWRCEMQQTVVAALREIDGTDVYDFRNPEPGNHGFDWAEIDPEWNDWKPAAFREALDHPIAQAGFERDMTALCDCDICVLVLPCGRSAHLEAGLAVGHGAKVIVLLAEGEPELMYLMAEHICVSLDEVVSIVSMSCKFQLLNVRRGC